MSLFIELSAIMFWVCVGPIVLLFLFAFLWTLYDVGKDVCIAVWDLTKRCRLF